jgi:beta-aspartyl-peptidase (threonine type)
MAGSLLLFGVVGSAWAQDDATIAGARNAEAAVRAVLSRQVEAWNRGDLEGFMAGYWNSPDLVFQSGATLTRGWQATLRFEELDVQPLGPDTAFVRGRWRLTMKDGSQPGGLFTLLLRRVSGDWKIVHDHTS